MALTRTVLSCFRAFLKALPLSCSPILPNLAGASVQLLVSCSHVHSVNDAAASLSCKAIAVLETILCESLYKANSNSRSTSDPAAKMQAVAAFDSFFTSATVGQLVDLLASSYCSLAPSQLARWDESPEAFSNECDSQVRCIP